VKKAGQWPAFLFFVIQLEWNYYISITMSY
jgi:hypothetical protein